MNFMCASCHRVCEWKSREPADSQEYKTIGSMYCNAPACLDAEASAHGLPLERIRAWHGLPENERAT